MKSTTNIQIVEVLVMKGQTLSEVTQIYPLPTNGIFHKRLPGLGATYGEINAPRHSIIVLPNRPVIEGKVAEHNAKCRPEQEILGIYKGITKEDVEAYLSKEHIIHKKILTTPEGYEGKLKEVVKNILGYVTKEYYLLIDECERTIQDIDYRHKITSPFDDFFHFTNKGLISATTLPFSDPRFERDFTHYLIVTDYKYKKPLTLIPTNNVLMAFKQYILGIGKHPCFIFLSSISAMVALIEAAGIKKDSKIHCSESKLTSLKMQGLKASHDLDIKSLAKYNFFTSRFYSAVDIKLDFKPDVLLLTEVLFAEHSILDPQTEVIQIVGRFRNGTNTITHITNFKSNITLKTPEQSLSYLEGQQEVYKEIILLREKLTTEGAQDAIKQILSELKFAKYFNQDGSFNWFMIDNYIQEERVMGMYQCKENLLKGYEFVNDHFELKKVEMNFALTDVDRLKRQSTQSRKEEIKQVVEQLKRLDVQPGSYILGGEELYNDLKTEYPNVVDAYKVIGEDGITQMNFLESRMKQAVQRVRNQRAFNHPDVLKAVYDKFTAPGEYTEMYISTTLQDIFDRHGIHSRASASHIDKYFNSQRTSHRRGGERFYKLHSKREMVDA